MTQGAYPGEDGTGSGSSAVVKWLAGFAIAIALAGGTAMYYRMAVCNQQIAPSGQTVTLCRSLQVTDPPLAAVALVVFIALMAFFGEVSGFGFSFKRQIRRAVRNSDEAIAKATDATNAARSAQQTSQVAEELAARTSRNDWSTRSLLDVRATINGLVEQYNRLRAEQQTGPERTARMTAIVSKMVSASSGLDRDIIDLDSYIGGPDDGRRVAAYSYLYANPDSRLGTTLAGAILAEPTRFGQYWGIRALRRLVANDPAALDLNSRRDLEQFLSRLGRNTDRAFELRQLLNEAQAK
jgi:hypothetical protein